MAVKILNSRFQLKTDTEENWAVSNLIPKNGEVIIYAVDNEHTSPRIKIGDGVHLVKNLPFISAGTINGIDLDNFVAQKVAHKLTFGNGEVYQFDGSEDVTVPVYTGNHTIN